MSKGVVIYAYDSKYDYVSAARFAANQVHKYLDLPVTLITNEPTAGFDNVIIQDIGESLNRIFQNSDGTVTETQWHNSNRANVYDLSPYDQTLMIDADYFMFNDSLKHIFDTNSEFACFNEVNDLTDINPTKIRLSNISIPMQWATVVYFTKNKFAKAVFDFMQHIRLNWEYYSLLYSFRSDLFRNDFALSIALQTLSGYSTKIFDKLPGKLHSLFSNIDIQEVRANGEIVYAYHNKRSKIINTNVHIMNKDSLCKFYA
jgi:hypothetical protein